MTRKLTQRELRDQGGEIMRELDRGEDFTAICNGALAREPRPIGPRRFAPREVFAAAIAHIPPEDYEQYKAEADAFFDPTSRAWPEDS